MLQSFGYFESLIEVSSNFRLRFGCIYFVRPFLSLPLTIFWRDFDPVGNLIFFLQNIRYFEILIQVLIQVIF